MSWDAKDVALLKKLWAVGQSAAQIARRVGCSRNAVCGRLTRLGLKRGHKPPTAKPKIRPVPKRRPALFGRLCTPGGEERVAEDSREAA
jgi:GcrA cell cycle regulator